MEKLKTQDISVIGREKLMAAISYFKNNHQKHRMNYAMHIEKLQKNHSIVSGVTEAACKVVVKQHLCESGMRILVYSGTHWNQFLGKISQYGFPIAA